VLAAVLTAIYTFRMWFSVFTGKERSDYHKHESPWIMLGPLVILAVFAFGFGIAAQDSFYNYLDTNFDHYGVNFNELAAIGGHPTKEVELAGEPATEPYVSEIKEKPLEETEAEPAEPWYIQILPIIVAIGGILLAGLFYWDRIKKFDPDQVTGDKDPLRRTLLKGYYQHEIFTAWFAETVVYGSALICNMIDIKLVDGWLNWLSAWVLGFAGHVRKVQTGVVQNYVTALVLGIVVLVLVIALAKEVGLA
jgi:NADH:ubiquinone oxidoreductase subunit 5 (subunit L)/multisubunit Na+/H+ antiporter MnhA subunit